MDYQFPSQEFDKFSPYELSRKLCKRFNPLFSKLLMGHTQFKTYIVSLCI